MANFKTNKNGKKNENKGFQNNKKVKPKFVKFKVNIADSDFYASNLDSLYNLLCSISFDKIAIPVYMSKSEVFNNTKLKGTTIVGTVIKFNNDNTFTISVQDSLADKFIEGEHVMSIRCAKDYETNEITYIHSFCIIKGNSVQEQYDDVEQAMLDAGEENTTEETTE